MARVSRKRKQEQAVEKLAVSRDEVYQCAVYIRLSKEENEKSDSHKLDNQEQVILNYVRKNSDLKIVKIYCDNGYSGTNFSRAAFGNDAGYQVRDHQVCNCERFISVGKKSY